MNKFRSLALGSALLAFSLHACAFDPRHLIDGFNTAKQAIHQKMLDKQAEATGRQSNVEEKKTSDSASRSPAMGHTGFSECSNFFVGGRSPALSSASQISLVTRELCFDSFAVLHSGKSKTPVFSAERLNRAQLIDAKGEERTNNFYPEARLPFAHRAQLEDFRGKKMDRGHMSPAADMPNSQSMAQSFSLANMVPQAPENNRGIWADLEKDTRKYAMRARGDVFVITGPVFSEPIRTIGPGKVYVPTHLFKLVFDKETGKSWAHWVENTNSAKMNAPISYAELTRRLGFELMPAVSLSSDR